MRLLVSARASHKALRSFFSSNLRETNKCELMRWTKAGLDHASRFFAWNQMKWTQDNWIERNTIFGADSVDSNKELSSFSTFPQHSCYVAETRFSQHAEKSAWCYSLLCTLCTRDRKIGEWQRYEIELNYDRLTVRKSISFPPGSQPKACLQS